MTIQNRYKGDDPGVVPIEWIPLALSFSPAHSSKECIWEFGLDTSVFQRRIGAHSAIDAPVRKEAARLLAPVNGKRQDLLKEYHSACNQSGSPSA